MEESFCNYHNRILNPDDMAYFIKRGQEDEFMDEVNATRFSEREKQEMRAGLMACRHFVYKNYCQITPFSYE